MDISQLYVNYNFIILYLKKVKVIQEYFRMYQFMNQMRKMIHKEKSLLYLHDIIEFGYMPPGKDYQLLKNGGFHYRESENNFYLRIKNM